MRTAAQELPYCIKRSAGGGKQMVSWHDTAYSGKTGCNNKRCYYSVICFELRYREKYSTSHNSL